jgi:hypothetical protein
MHFNALVVTAEDGRAAVEHGLAPFQHDKRCAPAFLQFIDTEHERRAKYETETVGLVRLTDERRVLAVDLIQSRQYDHLVVPGSRVEAPFREYYSTFDAFMIEWCEEPRDPKTGRYGRWDNPNAHWDYWGLIPFFSVGGTVVDHVQRQALDLRAIHATVRRGLLDTWNDYEAKKGMSRVVAEMLYGIPQTATREEYLAQDLRYPYFGAYAVVLDGVWHTAGLEHGDPAEEKTRTHRWAATFATLFDRIEPAQWMTLVDCHI